MTSVRKSLLSIWRKRKRGFSWTKNPSENGCFAEEETVWKQKEDLEEVEKEEAVREKKPPKGQRREEKEPFTTTGDR